MNASERELERLILTNKFWIPLPGPQLQGYLSRADETFYGGAAGGGKTDLACGLALEEHERVLMLRRQATNVDGMEDRLSEIIPSSFGFYNGQKKRWRFEDNRKVIRLGGMKELNDWNVYAGKPYDLMVFDELPQFAESQYRSLQGWNRTTTPGQRCRVLACGNPPTTSDGEWVISYWAPWLDPSHPNPAKPGDLRWFATVDGKDVELPSAAPTADTKGNLVYPRSRTFIPAKVEDNPYLIDTGYDKVLDALPEPLRSMLRNGDFNIKTEEDPWAIIPHAWVRAAMDRWRPDERPQVPMTRMGADVARGGKDQSAFAMLYGTWFDELAVYPGVMTPDGPTYVTLLQQAHDGEAPINIDLIGVGTSAFDILKGNNYQVEGVNGAAGSSATDKTGKFKMRNLRAEMWWRFREALDPTSGDDIALPDDKGLLRDLTAPRYKVTVSGILVESKEDMAARGIKSPDRGDAVVYAYYQPPKRRRMPGAQNVD